MPRIFPIISSQDFERYQKALLGDGMTIPSTVAAPNDYLWNSDPNVVGQSGLIQNASLGWIVQMKLASGIPHTAIIYSKDANGVTFLDSNWSNDNKVQTHYKTFTQFYAMLYSSGSYSLYYIL